MTEGDLLALAAHGRVLFHEVDEYLYWQGRPLRPTFLVVQQGTVTLWRDEGTGKERLHDVRGPGELLGIEAFLGAPAYLSSARAGSDVVLYALATGDLDALLERYPEAARYLAAHASVRASLEPGDAPARARRLALRALARPLLTCPLGTQVREAVRRMHEAGHDAIAVVAGDGRLRGVLSAARVLDFVGRGKGDTRLPVEAVMAAAPPTLGPEATASEGLLALAEQAADVAVLAGPGPNGGVPLALVTAATVADGFAEQPLRLLEGIAHAEDHAALAARNRRARAFVLDQLDSPSAVDWLTRFAARADARIVERAAALAGIDLLGAEADGACLFVFGASGRGESLTALSPQLGLVFEEPRGPGGDATPKQRATLRRLHEALQECGYVRRAPLSEAELGFRCASFGEWEARFRGLVRDPVEAGLYEARPVFDLRPLAGRASLLAALGAAIREEVARRPAFLRILANDCLANLPPLSFFRDLVIEDGGERSEVFALERSALRPLVDVGRVFALAAGRCFSTSSLERFRQAAEAHPAHAAILGDAADTLRVVLYHQARSGIRRQDGGREVPPASLGRHDRELLKTAFRSILRLLELTAEGRWLEPR
jgi:CBS domain-containing protein